MKKTMKNNLKSVRMSDFTLAVIEDMPGEGFNQKFEKLVYDYSQNCRDIQSRITTLQAEEKRLIERLDFLTKQANRCMPDISRYLNNIAQIVKHAPIEGQTSL